MSEMDGILVIRKEKGWTSHDVGARLRGILHMKKIGHTGTLDPEAEGVLPVALGSATRLCELLTDKEKTYEAVLCLGITTDTQDLTGEALRRQTPEVSREQLEGVLAGFLGEQQQIPPMYSAVKVGGRRLYELAREGKTVERKPRPVTFHELRISGEDPVLDLSGIPLYVRCSRGTYIRTLCHDIGERLGCGGCMASLVRTRSGSFTLEKSYSLSQVEAAARDGSVSGMILGIEDVLADYPALSVLERGNRLLANGNPLPEPLVSGGEKKGLVRMYFSDHRLKGLYQWKDSRQLYCPVKIFP